MIPTTYFNNQNVSYSKNELKDFVKDLKLPKEASKNVAPQFKENNLLALLEFENKKSENRKELVEDMLSNLWGSGGLPRKPRRHRYRFHFDSLRSRMNFIIMTIRQVEFKRRHRYQADGTAR